MSKSKEAFNTALKDVTNLQEFHEAVGGSGPGKRSTNLASLNKSGIVLLCATWELYIETVVIECTERHLGSVDAPALVLKSLSKLVTDFVQTEKDDRAWHKIVNNGWKDIIKSAVFDRVGRLNTPKTTQVSNIFSEILGIKNITDDWVWYKSKSQIAITRLDNFVKLRGAIAHGEQQSANVTKAAVMSAQDLITRLVEKIEGRLVKDGLL